MTAPVYLQTIRQSQFSKTLRRVLERNMGLNATVRAREAVGALREEEQARLAVSRLLFEDEVHDE
ncbi:hypothetical protein [Pseudomonas aeruginosa]|uniref:hypothetical protein n=1 Tax=Pseudomonas aeruginosa TaxID=287 RepID=UPI0024557C9C|nr:hypothetical protein [Pseudomonas aeruginosa]MDH4704162.1 hypothetical protein [Pseudomonas aeruginosa]